MISLIDGVYTCRRKRPLLFGRIMHATCAGGGRDLRYIYVSGGDEDAKKVECYDIQTDAWTEFPDLNVGRMEHAMCCQMQGENLAVLYAFCGERNGLASIERLLPFEDW